jgi:hypothetical protein
MNHDSLNKYRVFPRLFAIFYLYWMGEVVKWAMGLPDLSTAQAGFVAAVITGAAAYFKFYVETGCDKKGD